MNNSSFISLINGWRKFVCCAMLPLAVALVACSGDSEPEPPALDAPRFLSSTPTSGTKDVPEGELTIVLVYDQNVTSPSGGHSQLTVGDATVAGVSANLTNVTVQLTGLVKGKTYQLIVPIGVVLGPTKVEAPQVTVTFSTVEEAAVGPVAGHLCTPNPSQQAKNVYNYLAEVYGEKILSGTMANVNWNIAEAELVQKATGKYPAIAFFDYIHLYASPANWIDYSDTKVAEEWWNAGGLVGASWHWNVPMSEAASVTEVTYDPLKTTFRTKNATVDGTWENRIVKADLEKMAGYLNLLQDKHIPVIWRPLHEAAGNIYEYSAGKAWFWWGYDGADAYKKLWIYMFDFFKQKGIHNLIWVWTTQQKDADFYPGDAYVDIVGRDIYDQTAGGDNAAQYKAIAKAYSNKLVALSECGNVTPISMQWNADARWLFFMPWYQYNATTLVGHEHADEKWWKDAMNQAFVVTRDQLPSMK